MENERQKPKSRPLAFCAMMAALGTMLMLTGGLIPVLTYCSPLLASFSLFYLFLGWYPILKPTFDSIPARVPRFFIKLLTFCAAIGCMYLLIFFVFQIGDIIESFSGLLWVNILFFAGLAAIMMMYDRVLIGIWLFYYKRIRKFIVKS